MPGQVAVLRLLMSSSATRAGIMSPFLENAYTFHGRVAVASQPGMRSNAVSDGSVASQGSPRTA